MVSILLNLYFPLCRKAEASFLRHAYFANIFHNFIQLQFSPQLDKHKPSLTV